MTRHGVALALALAAAAPAYAQLNPGAAIRGRVGIEDRLEQPSLALAALEKRPGRPSDLPVFVRLDVSWATLQGLSSGKWAALDERLNAYARRELRVLLAIGPPTAALSATETWTPVIKSLAEHVRGRVAGYQLEAARPVPDAREYAFQLKFAAVQIRAIDPQALIAQATATPADVDWLVAVYADGTAPYVDIAPFAAPNPVLGAHNATDALTAAIAARDPSAFRLQIGVALGKDASRSADRLLTTVVSQLGEPGMLGCTFTGSADALAAALGAATEVKDLLNGELVPIDDRALSLTIDVDGRNVTASLPHRVFYDASGGGTYVVYWGVPASVDRLTLTLVDQSARSPVVRDPVRREVSKVQAFSWDPATKLSRMTARASRTPLVLDFNYDAADAFVSRAEVSAASLLSVDEIVARHQQAQAAQTNAFKTFIASLRLELHFRPSATQVFDVISENRFFYAPDTVEWEERSFSVNGVKWGPDRPPLPLLQAEKVLSLPLDLRLTADYRYRLERTETVGERPCYVLAFEPNDVSQSRYRGWVWIDSTTFLRVKVQSIQTRLEGPIVSSEEVALYEPVQTIRGTPIFLPTRLSTKQMLLVAGRNLLLEKEQWFSDFHVDAPEFESERQAARAGPQVMFRDTDAGIRYLVKRGADRVVSNQIRTSSKAMAMGTTLDPTFAFPLPILGLNYLNFDVRGTGSQFALLFGGVFALGNLQTAKIGKTPFDGSVDFFGIAVPGTDLRFDSTGERVDERVLGIPASTGVNIGYQFTPFQKISLGYSWRYDAYFRAPQTADDFVVPSRTSTHGATVGYEYSRHGYRIGGSVSKLSRTSWRNWGREGDFNADDKTYRRYSVNATKDFLFGPFQTAHVAGAWYGGARLDRFSMYQFGLFDEVRMHGVPSSGIRFAELVLLRGSYSFNLLGIYRLDLFVDHARGRDPNDPTAWRPVTGTGGAVTLKAPWNTMFTADIGKSFIPDLYRGTGSVVLQFLFLKPL